MELIDLNWLFKQKDFSLWVSLNLKYVIIWSHYATSEWFLTSKLWVCCPSFISIRLSLELSELSKVLYRRDSKRNQGIEKKPCWVFTNIQRLGYLANLKFCLLIMSNKFRVREGTERVVTLSVLGLIRVK